MRNPAILETLSIGSVTATITGFTPAGCPVATHLVVLVPAAVLPDDQIAWAMWNLNRFLEDHAPALVPDVDSYEVKPFPSAFSYIFS